MNDKSPLNLVSVKCPDCGAALSIEEGRKQAFCTYCGAKVLIQNDNEHVYRTIDEAEIAKQEKEKEIALREKEIRLKEIEVEAANHKQAVKMSLAIIGGMIFLVIVLFLLMYFL